MATVNFDVIDQDAFASAYVTALANQMAVDAVLEARANGRGEVLQECAIAYASALTAERIAALNADANVAYNEWMALHRLGAFHPKYDHTNTGTSEEYIAGHRQNYPGDWWKPLYTETAGED